MQQQRLHHRGAAGHAKAHALTFLKPGRAVESGGIGGNQGRGEVEGGPTGGFVSTLGGRVHPVSEGGFAPAQAQRGGGDGMDENAVVKECGVSRLGI